MPIVKKNLSEVSPAIRSAFQKAQDVLSKNSLDYGIELLKEIAKKDPGFLDSRILLRKAEKTKYARMNVFQKVLAQITSLPPVLKGGAIVSKKPLEALGCAEDALAINIASPLAYNLLAQAAIALEANFIAVEAYEALVDRDTKNEANLKKLAELYEADGQGAKVLHIRQIIAAKYPDNLEAQAALRAAAALATMEQGKWNEEGSSVAKSAKAANKKGGEKQVRDDRIIRAEEDIREMIGVYEKRVASGDESIDMRRKLAELYQRDKRFQDAIDTYQWLVEKMGTLDPTIDKAIEACQIELSNLRIAELKEKNAPQEEIDKEVDAINKYRLERGEDRIRLYPNDTLIRYDLAVLYWEFRMLDKALEQFQLAQRNPQKRLSAIVYLGRCFAEKKQYDMAVEQYDKAISEMPVMDKEKMNAIYHLGVTCEEMGNDKQAMECFKQIYSTNVNYLDVAKRMDAYYARLNAAREQAKAEA